MGICDSQVDWKWCELCFNKDGSLGGTGKPTYYEIELREKQALSEREREGERLRIMDRMMVRLLKRNPLRANNCVTMTRSMYCV